MPTPPSASKLPAAHSGSTSSIGNLARLTAPQDSHVLNETLNVINEHITDMRGSSPGHGHLHATGDSGSEYSGHLDRRMSYINGEETDEEEESMHTRTEVESWSADQVAEYLFTSGVEKQHCEVFQHQEISGEVLLSMDQSSLFIKAFDLGSVGRRLKTWHKIQALQNEVKGGGIATRRTTQTYGSEAGSEGTGKARSRTNTLTNPPPPSYTAQKRLPAVDDRPEPAQQPKRLSTSQTPRFAPANQGVAPVSPNPSAGAPDSPMRPYHEKRPSAASVRDLHHSRRHSSNDFRLTGTTINTTTTPKLAHSGTFPQSEATVNPSSHKKQPSFDRNWTLGSAAAGSPRPLSSAGFPQDALLVADPGLQDLAVDLDRGYFSGTEVDGRRRNVLRKRDSVQPGGHSAKSSYTDEARMRSATAAARHSRFGSVDSARDMGPTAAAQKYYGIMGANPHRRNTSAATVESIRPVLPPKDKPSPTINRIESSASDVLQRSGTLSPSSPANRQGVHGDWFAKPGAKNPGLGVRAISEAVTGTERATLVPGVDSPLKDSPLHSPARTGSSTPSGGPSFELDSPDAKSPSTATTIASRNSRKSKTKQETSAYLRGLQKVSPPEAMQDADYSGWMKKKSSNLMTTWKSRLFVLKGRRLAYYYSENDFQEKGLIDISFHRVLPADNERLTGLHATLTGASNKPTVPQGNHVATQAEVQAEADPTSSSDAMFIFKLVPPRAGLSRAVNFTKPTVHYFAVPNIKQGRLWMAALMKATIDRDDAKPITTTYQQKTISLAKARAMRHRPPALMNLDEKGEELVPQDEEKQPERKEANGLGIVYNDGNGSEMSALDKLGLQKVESAKHRNFGFEKENPASVPQSA
jgi:hypothetical protein